MSDLARARDLVERTGDRPLGRMHSRGYAWFWANYVPAVERLARARAKQDRRLAAEGCGDIGDVHDINGAPRAAAEAYRRAVDLEPEYAYGWQELGFMQWGLGHYRSAIAALRRAVDLAPEDDTAQLRLSWAKQSLASGKTAEFAGVRPALIDEVDEHLARQEPTLALKRLDRRRSLEMRQARARVFGALGDTESQIREWEAVVSCKGHLVLDPVDWFFTRRGTWNSPRFWRAMHRLGGRLTGIGPKQLDGLFRALPEPAGSRYGSAARERRYDRRRRLVVRYHLARTTRDLQAAQRLANRYPRWSEAQRLVVRLTS